MADYTIDKDAPTLDLLGDEKSKALAYGAWQCPQCPEGWQVYMIAIDMNVCAKCGYKGGPISTNGGKPQSEDDGNGDSQEPDALGAGAPADPNQSAD
jgi:Zn ribbon nucleic-acid-binding protein